MNIDDYISILREECQVLPPSERLVLDEIFASRYGPRIFLIMEELRESGKVKSDRFEKALEDLYWVSR